MRADASILVFSTVISFGLPVLPLVFTVTVALPLRHSFRKSSALIRFCLQKYNIYPKKHVIRTRKMEKRTK